jgi:hypothetical protein
VVFAVVSVGRVCITSTGKFAVAKISDWKGSDSQIATGGAVLGDKLAKKSGSFPDFNLRMQVIYPVSQILHCGKIK